MALMSAQKVEKEAPARLLLFCSPLLLLPALPVPELWPWEVAVVFFSTRLVLKREGCTCTFAASTPDGTGEVEALVDRLIFVRSRSS